MTSPDKAFSLRDIGHELDRARQKRAGHGSDSNEAVSPTSDSSTSPSSMTQSLSTDFEPERLPLCLLCFTRPPSAVLLPCCHLNLCHLCAPLLLLKHRRPVPTSSATARSSPPIEHPALERIPFNQALMRASANHPKSRRLSMGYCDPPERGTRGGGEVRGGDVMKSAVGDASEGVGLSLSGDLGEDGQVSLRGGESGAAAQCLLCRAGVSGWLRVYTG